MASVYELLRYEAEQAVQLAQAQARHRQATGQTAQVSVPQASAPELLAIYGKGKHLLAEVRLSEGLLLFQTGYAQEIGRDRSQGRLRLRALNTRCADFIFDGQDIHLCLEP